MKNSSNSSAGEYDHVRRPAGNLIVKAMEMLWSRVGKRTVSKVIKRLQCRKCIENVYTPGLCRVWRMCRMYHGF